MLEKEEIVGKGNHWYPGHEEKMELVDSLAAKFGWDSTKYHSAERLEKGWYYPNPFVFLNDLAKANGWKTKYPNGGGGFVDTLAAADHLEVYKNAGKEIKPVLDIKGKCCY